MLFLVCCWLLHIILFLSFFSFNDLVFCLLKLVNEKISLSVWFSRPLHLKRRKFSLSSYSLFFKIGRWKNYRQFLRSLMLIRQVFILKFLFVEFINIFFIHYYVYYWRYANVRLFLVLLFYFSISDYCMFIVLVYYFYLLNLKN